MTYLEMEMNELYPQYVSDVLHLEEASTVGEYKHIHTHTPTHPHTHPHTPTHAHTRSIYIKVFL